MIRNILPILVLTVVALNACIDPVDINTTEEKKLLVVEGFISTKPGPHTFKLSKSAKYGSIFVGFSQKEENATIFIKDDLGKQVFLDELSPGLYQTPKGYQAEVGRTYTLIINSKSGQYISLPEKLEPVPIIKKLEARFKKFPSVIPEIFKSGIEIYSTFDDPADSQNFMFWDARGTFIMNTRPDLFTYRDGEGKIISAPKDCCARCFFEERKAEAEFRIYSDSKTNGNENRVLAAYIPDDGARFDEKYLIRIEQYSLSRKAFQFYNLLNEQLSISGDIFDPPPAGTNGNIVNITNPEQQVIGFFHASDYYSDSIYIEKSAILEANADKLVPEDCRVLGGDVNTPSYWH